MCIEIDSLKFIVKIQTLSGAEKVFIIASATFMPSIAAEVMPPCISGSFTARVNPGKRRSKVFFSEYFYR